MKIMNNFFVNMYTRNSRFSKFLKFISLTLILTLIFTSMPLDGFAALAEQWAEDSRLITVEKELEEYRTEFSKTYLKSDGTLESVVSSLPIHFMENGEWVEIDSTLEADENKNGTEILKNKKGSFNVELPTEIENGSEIAIEKGENKISIKLLETKNSKAKKNKDKKEKAEKLTKAQRKRMTAGELFEVDNNQTSTLEYNAVYNDTDLRYDVTPNEVKESIVLQKAPNKKATYSYEITADGLTAVLNKDNSIDFYKGAKAENATPVFSMPAPHMFDSNGEYSYDIATTLESKKGKYILTYKPSYEWLKNKNRAYPVTVDPTVVVNSGVQAAYTYSAESYLDTYLGYEQQLKVGNSDWQSESDSFYTYLKFTDLPQIPYEDYRIDSAYLMLTPGATRGTWEEMELGVYELTEDWKTHQNGNATERITYNNAPGDVGFSTATATVSRGGADSGVGVGFEIAHIVEKWYENPETNYGVKLAAHLEEGQNNANIIFYSTAATASGKAPYISLTYTTAIPVTGIEIIGKQERLEYRLSTSAFAVSANVYPENAIDKEVIWESTNPSAAYYNYGYIWAVGVGTTTIIAKSAENNEIVDSFDLEVYNIPIETITITNRPENDTLESGTTHQLDFEVGPDNASDKNFVEVENYVNWYSSDSEIVSVDRYTGIITANSLGTANITVKHEDLTTTIEITVTPARIPIKGVGIVIPIETMFVGTTDYIYFNLEPYNATDKRAIATSSDDSIISVEVRQNESDPSVEPQFVLTAHKEGRATITVTFLSDPTKTLTETVEVISGDFCLTLPYDNAIGIGETWDLSTNPNARTDPKNDGIISVDAFGNITGVGAGITSVEVWLGERSNFAHIEITVVQSIDLEIDNIPTLTDGYGNEFNGIYLGDRYESLLITTKQETNAEIVWSSSDDDIAEVYYDYVKARVVLIGKKLGTVTIYAEVVSDTARGSASFELEVVGDSVESFCIESTSAYSAIADGILYVGESGFLQVNILYPESEHIYFNKIEWYVSEGNADCVRFEDTGTERKVKVYALNLGNIEISAIIDDEIITFLNYELEIRKPSSIITVPANHTVRIGTEYTFKAKIIPEYVVGVWSSSNTNVGTINSNGVFQALSNGETEISLSYEVGGETYTHTVKINVSDVVITNLPENRVLFVDGIRDLDAKVYLNNTTSQDVVWKTSDSSVAIVDSKGNITGKKAGKVTITATYKNDTSQKSWVTITVKKTKSYYFYMLEGDTAFRASLEADQIAAKYYGGITNSIYVEKKAITSHAQFVSEWANMGNDGFDIGYVIINCHGSPNLIGDNQSWSTDIYDIINSNKFNKSVEGLIFLSCNVGHLDYCTNEMTNIAAAFAQKLNGAPVIASDGTVGDWGENEKNEHVDAIENVTQYNNSSDPNDDFMKLNKSIGSNRTQNEGWLIYTASNSSINIYSTVAREVFDEELNKKLFQFYTIELFEAVHKYSLNTRIRKVDINA